MMLLSIVMILLNLKETINILKSMLISLFKKIKLTFISQIVIAYVIPMVIYGTEFKSTIKETAPINQVARGGPSVTFDSNIDAHLGYSYWYNIY